MSKERSKLVSAFTFRAPIELWGSAITYVHEREDGSMWVGNDEYESRVNFCPMTGRPAKTQMAATESTSPYTDSAYAVTIHTIYQVPAKERYSEIIDKAYKNFERQCIPGTGKKMSKEEFLQFSKTNDEFSKEWGLKIEERELSLEERAKWLQDNKKYDLLVGNLEHDHVREVVEEQSPTRLITITYSHETIEVYE